MGCHPTKAGICAVCGVMGPTLFDTERTKDTKLAEKHLWMTG